MPVVFINYRVREQPGYATLLHRELSSRFGVEQVFIASRSIRPGDDFAREVFESLRHCSILLAVIGPHWLSFRSTSTFPGLSDDIDWVVREIAEAFTLGIRVIPVLIEDAELPDEANLPADIATLARCQYLRLRHYSIETDITQLIDELNRIVPTLAQHRLGANTLMGLSIPQNDTREAFNAEGLIFQVAGAPHSPCRIGVIPGSIRRVRCADIWVNSENTDMEMARFTEFSISGIIRYWGARRDEMGRVTADCIADELAAKVGRRRPVAPGTVIVTTAGALTESNNVRHIVHVAAVHGEPGAGFRQVQNIGWCVTNALIEAERLADRDDHIRTILIPLLGTGVAGANIESTVRAMLDAALDHLIARPNTSLRAIYFLAYRNTELAVFRTLWRLTPMAQILKDQAIPHHRQGSGQTPT